MHPYSTWFFITDPVSNNQFDYCLRQYPKIYIPKLIEGDLDDVQISSDTYAIETLVWENLHSEKGLKNFIFLKNARVPTWICDNHNHAFVFWYDALQKWYIQKGSLLVHIDQHTDLATPKTLLIADEEFCWFKNLQDVQEYTNTVLTIADFIVPALANGLLAEALMVTGENKEGVNSFVWQDNKLQKTIHHKPKTINSVIVDLDLDYFSQGFDESETFSTVRYWLARADIVTIATSPLFIPQDKAIGILKSLQKDLLLL